MLCGWAVGFAPAWSLMAKLHKLIARILIGAVKLLDLWGGVRSNFLI